MTDNIIDSDIVELLRVPYEEYLVGNAIDYVMAKGADTIEALRAENARLQKDLHEYVMQAESGNQKQVAEMCELRKEITRLREENQAWIDGVKELIALRAARAAIGDSDD